ncbi:MULTISPECIES: hypothetical protein [unclassified Streptomyces]|uniref:hypothetical protein n=1 Tax=unclassified Streptomyces TaxID=2593676 RepID=UPI00336ABA44
MNVPATSEEIAAVMAQLRLLAPAAPDLPGDADLVPALTSAGTRPGQAAGSPLPRAVVVSPLTVSSRYSSKSW